MEMNNGSNLSECVNGSLTKALTAAFQRAQLICAEIPDPNKWLDSKLLLFYATTFQVNSYFFYNNRKLIHVAICIVAEK